MIWCSFLVNRLLGFIFRLVFVYFVNYYFPVICSSVKSYKYESVGSFLSSIVQSFAVWCVVASQAVVFGGLILPNTSLLKVIRGNTSPLKTTAWEARYVAFGLRIRIMHSFIFLGRGMRSDVTPSNT